MVVRARDVRVNIAELGFEKGIVQSLERTLEEYAEIRQHMRQMTELLAQCIDEVGKMIHVGDGLRHSIEQIQRDRQQGEDHGEPEG